MIAEVKIIEIFCNADDFYKYFSSELKKHQLSDGKKHRNKPWSKATLRIHGCLYKIMLRKRALVESANDELKNIAQIEHSHSQIS